jgi:hypothetical protein
MRFARIWKPRRNARLRLKSKLLGLWIGQIMSGDDIAFDFMTEHEIAEIIATEDIFQVDMSDIDDLLEDVASDSDYE